MIYKRLSQFSNLLYFEVEDIASWLQCLSFYLLIHLNPPPLVENLSSSFSFFFPLLHKFCLPWFLRILFFSNLFLSVIYGNTMRSNNYRIWSSKAQSLHLSRDFRPFRFWPLCLRVLWRFNFYHNEWLRWNAFRGTVSLPSRIFLPCCFSHGVPVSKGLRFIHVPVGMFVGWN